jgi:imidazolonepropionase-like amidohydrolase
VHALSESGIAGAVRFGADLVVHSGFPPAETVAEMKKRMVHRLLTLQSFSSANAATLSALHEHMGKAVSAGLPIAFGTDAGVIPHGTNAREFERLPLIGMDAPASLRTATLAAARAVGLAGEIGALTPGYAADVIGVEGNPLNDLRVLQRVTFVMRGGRVFTKSRRTRLRIRTAIARSASPARCRFR